MLDLPGTPVNGVTNTVIATTSSVTVNATNGLTIFWGAYTSDVGSLFSILVPAGTGITFTYLDDVAGWVVTATSLASVYSIGNNFSTAGQMIVGSGADTATILDPGTDGQYLVADSTQPAGLNWHTIPATVDTGWINITFESGGGWTNFGSGWQTGQYRTINNEVICRGLIGGGTLGNPGTGITYLPAPAANHLWNQRAYGSVNYDMSVRVDILATGHLYVNETAAQTANWLSLDGIRYYLS